MENKFTSRGQRQKPELETKTVKPDIRRLNDQSPRFLNDRNAA
jgi:hypothetical protein